MCRPCRISLVVSLLILAGIWLPNPSRSCGMYFPNGLLEGNGDGVLWAPTESESLKLERLFPCPPPPVKYLYVPPEDQSWKQTADTEEAELLSVLSMLGYTQREQNRMISEYGQLRDSLTQYAMSMNENDVFKNLREDPRSKWLGCIENLRQNNWVIPGYRNTVYSGFEQLEVPDWIPDEYSLYLQGAIEFYSGDWERARETWSRIFTLPYRERQHRSVWAAYMIGKTYVYENPEMALGWFERVRRMADMGYLDRLGLAASTYLWEAKIAESRGDYAGAIKLYADVYRSGGWGGILAAETAVNKAFAEGPESIDDLTRDPFVRDLVTVFMDSSGRCRPYSEDTLKWLVALEKANVTDMQFADILACTAYRAGEFDFAEMWLERSRQTPLADWIRAKLLMRDGQIEQAADVLERVVNEYPKDAYWDGIEAYYWDVPGLWSTGTFPAKRALGELGVLQLTTGRFQDALDSLLRGNFWYDAAYVAESVLTVDELKAYVDSNWPDPGSDVDIGVFYDPEHITAERSQDQAYRIRYLLARRLSRHERFNEARAYYPEPFRMTLDRYMDDLRNGGDSALPDNIRADFYWDAAVVARHSGMELMGTELEPDWSLCGGNSDYGGFTETRLDPNAVFCFPITQAERQRIERTVSQEQPKKRFHYRYIALEHAWSCAALMPDNDEELAYRLCVAGGWVKYRDPEAADPFYKAMVNRCRNTPLGQAAEEIRWFPDCGWSGESDEER